MQLSTLQVIHLFFFTFNSAGYKQNAHIFGSEHIAQSLTLQLIHICP